MSEHQRRQILAMYQNNTQPLLIASALGVTQDEVIDVLHDYDCRIRKWTPADVQQLKEIYPVMSTPECAKLMNRDEKSIWNKANTLKLHKSNYVKSLTLSNAIKARNARRPDAMGAYCGGSTYWDWITKANYKSIN